VAELRVLAGADESLIEGWIPEGSKACNRKVEVRPFA
jgi:hypothetical protein